MSTAVSHRDEPRAVRPPQFGLRTLLLSITALSVLFALMTMIGAWASLLLGLVLLLVTAHVFGNALGTKLRDLGSAAEPSAEMTELAHSSSMRTVCFAPSKRLTETTRVSGSMLAMTAIGALAGGIVGGAALAALNWQQISWAGIGLAICSSAVLGGFAGFLSSSFFTIARRAWHEALEQDK